MKSEMHGASRFGGWADRGVRLCLSTLSSSAFTSTTIVARGKRV
jgi:hypothetical protein